MKRLLALLLAAMMLMSMTAVLAEEKTSYDIRALIWKYDDTYGSTVRAAMEKWVAYYAAEYGVTINFTMYDAADDMAKQIEQATLIVSEATADFVIINLAEVSNGQVLVDMFTEAGIPFLFYNKQPAEETVQTVLVDSKTLFIGTIAEEAGMMQGQILFDLYTADPASVDLNGDGVIKYAMLKGEADNDEAIARTAYSVSTAEELGLDLEIVGDVLVCDWDQALAQDAITAVWASSGTEIEVIFANNDMMGLGAIAALNAYGYNTGEEGAPSITVIGVDAVDSALEAISAGKMTGTVKQDGDEMGRMNIFCTLNYLMGKDWIEGSDYSYSTEDAFSCIRIPYAMITAE